MCVSAFFQSFLPLPEDILLDPAGQSILLPDHHRGESLDEYLFFAEEVILLDFPAPLLALLLLIVLGVPGGLQLILGACGAVIEIVLVIFVIAVDDADEFLQFLPGVDAVG